MVVELHHLQLGNLVETVGFPELLNDVSKKLLASNKEFTLVLIIFPLGLVKVLNYRHALILVFRSIELVRPNILGLV